MPAWLLSGTSGLFGLFGSEGTCPTREIFVTGQASRPVAGSIVPARLFTSGWLNMSYVICPVASPVPPASSNSTMLKPPIPGSFGDSTSMPPPPSCSPVSGRSSSNTNTDSFEGGKGSGCVSTVRDGYAAPAGTHDVWPVAGVQLTATPLTVAVQVVLVVGEQDTRAAIGVPPMPWPQAPGLVAAAEPLVQSALRLPLANGLPASPGKIVR